MRILLGICLCSTLLVASHGAQARSTVWQTRLVSVLEQGKLLSSKQFRVAMRRAVAGAVAVGVTCASLMGCGFKYSVAERVAVKKTQGNVIVVGSAMVVGGVLWGFMDEINAGMSINPDPNPIPVYLVLGGLAVAVGGAVWDVSSTFEDDALNTIPVADDALHTLPGAEARALRTYLRTNLTPPQYRNLPALAGEDSWLVIPSDRPLTAPYTIANLLGQLGDEVPLYHGRTMQNGDQTVLVVDQVLAGNGGYPR